MHPLKGEAEFAWRGDSPTRVEALSDMVFAFALTLLVVSSAPPASFAELGAQLWGFPGFAAAFAILLVIWHAHYIFFRRYALEDVWTTTLNAALLFLILFFVYPLKYLATMLSQFVRTLAEGRPRAPFTYEEAEIGLALMSVAYAAVFAMFLALYLHALAKADALELTERERQFTRLACWEQGVHVAIGALVASCALLLSAPWAALSGFLFCLIGPLIFIGGLLFVPRARKAPRPSM